MATMKYPNIPGGTNMAVSANSAPHDDVDSLFTSSCWQTSPLHLQSDFIDAHSLSLDSSMSHLGADKLLLSSPLTHPDHTDLESDALDKLFLHHPPPNSTSLAELKPLPPFTGYTANLSINGIQGHHYHQISQRHHDEENNNTTYAAYPDHNIVSSSTCATPKLYDVDKLAYADSGSDCKEMAEYDISLDFANIIGSAMADTTVASTNEGSRDSWMDALIDDACTDPQKSLMQDGLAEFVLPQSEYKPLQQPGSTLQTLLTHGYMPLLQNRLQNGPPIKQEPTSSGYGSELISTSSPPSNVVSTTDSLMMNGRFLYGGQHVEEPARMRSPETANYAHTTTGSSPKKGRSRAAKKQQAVSTSSVYQGEVGGGLMGKEKPVHRCSICNRGFLNKSNIKVHLRTHTGEKPFRCDTCAKAFRQKAHLLKHQQIHKRIGRD